MTDENDDIERYHENSLSGAERNALEKKALSDPFLADALEGVESVSPEDFSKDLKELSEKVRHQQVKPRFTALRIAAGILVLISACSLFYYYSLPSSALSQAEKSAEPLVNGDSVSAGVEDSTSALLTMAKAEGPAEADKHSPDQSPSKGLAKVIQGNPADTISSKGAAGEVQKTETQSRATVRTEEEKSDILVKAISDDKKEGLAEVQPLTSPAGAGIESKSTGQVSRRAKAKDASVLTYDYKTISGKVTAAEDGSPLPGVNVTIKGSAVGTVTDVRGNYSLSLNSGNPRLVYSYIGLQTYEINPEGKSTLDVQMSEDVSQLSEVVVVGRSPDTDLRDDLTRVPVVRLAAPAGGLRAYNKYLNDNLRYPEQALENKIKGKVTVQFTITTGGNLTEFNVLKGLGHGCDEEVIRLVKEGPKWNPSTEDDVPVESEVKVKMKFDPEKANKEK